MNDSELSIVIRARDQASSVIKSVKDDIDRSTRGMSAAFDGVRGITNKVEHALLGIGAGALAAGGLVAGFATSAVKSYMDSENAAAQLNAVIKSTAGAAGVTADMANELATALQRETRYSDEAVLSAQNMLLTFTNIKSDVFPDTTKAVLDMATAMGSDLTQTSIQVGKALQDPIQGVSALQRVGVRLTDQQKDQVEAMVKAGKTADAQRLILKELQTEFGGSAKAAGETFAGKLDRLRNRLDDVKEGIGKVIIDGLTPMSQRLSDFVNSDQFQQWIEKATIWIQENLPKAIDYMTNVVFPNLKNIIEETWPTVQMLLEKAMDLFNWLSNHTGVVEALVGAFVALKAALLLESTFSAVVQGVTVTQDAFKALFALVGCPSSALAFGVFSAAAVVAFQAIQNEINELIGQMNTLTQSSMSATDQLAAAKKEYDQGTITFEQYKQKVAELSGQLQGAATDADNLAAKTNNLFNFTLNPVESLRRTIKGYDALLSGDGLGAAFDAANGRAVGGPVSAGTPYIVGEQRPELFVPNVQGRIEARPEGTGGGVQITITGNVYNQNAEASEAFWDRASRLARMAQKGMPA